MWVPILENNEYDKPGADYFVKKHIDRIMEKDRAIDTLLLACTHYPLLLDKIRKYLPEGITVLSQGEIVASVGISSPVTRLHTKRIPHAAAEVVATAQLISKSLAA